MNKIFVILIVGSFLQCLYDIFITNRISSREAKKANYNCEHCKNWRCYHFYCLNKRQEKEQESDKFEK